MVAVAKFVANQAKKKVSVAAQQSASFPPPSLPSSPGDLFSSQEEWKPCNIDSGPDVKKLCSSRCWTIDEHGLDFDLSKRIMDQRRQVVRAGGKKSGYRKFI